MHTVTAGKSLSASSARKLNTWLQKNRAAALDTPEKVAKAVSNAMRTIRETRNIRTGVL